MQNATLLHVGLLLALGTGWGATQPLTKIAVSTGYQPLGLIFWQLVIGAAAMGALCAYRGRGLPLTRFGVAACLIIALIGTILPNSASYRAIAHLPSGIVSILLSLIPMMAFPIALGLKLETFSLRRFLGLGAGLTGVLLLILPEASLPDRAMLAWIPVALIAPFCYAFEGNYVARWGTAGLGPFRLLFGASLIGAAISLPMAVASGQFISPLKPWGAPEWAFLASSLIHVTVYAGYVWLVGRAGAVFAVQVSYVVTLAGVLWAMLLLGERYAPNIWLALACVLLGVFLVQPRSKDGLAQDGAMQETAAKALPPERSRAQEP